MKKNDTLKKVILVFVSILAVFSLGFPLMIGDKKQGEVELNEKVDLSFDVSEDSKVILLYFGYVGCKTICEPSLREISKVYDTLLEADKKIVKFYFVNITKNGTESQPFAEFFNDDFIGLDLKKKEISKLMLDFRAYSSDSLSGDGEISHTGYLYLIKQTTEKEFELKRIYYTRPFDPDSIVQNIKQEL